MAENSKPRSQALPRLCAGAWERVFEGAAGVIFSFETSKLL